MFASITGARPQAWRPSSTSIAFLFVLGLLLLDAAFSGAYAQAASTNVFSDLTLKGTDFFYKLRTIVLILCAIGIIATMATAISGRFPVSKAITIAGAIVIIAFSSSIVTYFASPGQNTTPSAVPYMGDTGTATGG